MKFTERELKGFKCFLMETFEFTEEQSAAIDHQIPMTQEIYDSILDRCDELGPDVDPLFYRMLTEFPDFMCNYADRIMKEIGDIELPELPEEDSEKMKEELFKRIREQYGEDSI